MQTFRQTLSYLDTQEFIEYFSVFEGYDDLKSLTYHDSLLENILENVLKKYDDLKSLFIFSENNSLQKDTQKLLYRLAVGNRKSYSVYKNDISFYRGKTIYKLLFEKGFIQKEYSREEPTFIVSKRRKKEFRGYQIEDKIRFSKSFYRFWFMFIYPYKREIEEKNYTIALENIEKNLDYFISQNFEFLSNQLLVSKLDIVESGSYWDKYVEFDVYAKSSDGRVFIGECKWTNHKVNGNILNKLKKKCAKSGLDVDCYLLFSKSGFSNELLKQEGKELKLYDIKDFKGMFSAK